MSKSVLKEYCDYENNLSKINPGVASSISRLRHIAGENGTLYRATWDSGGDYPVFNPNAAIEDRWQGATLIYYFEGCKKDVDDLVEAFKQSGMKRDITITGPHFKTVHVEIG